jgi:hypothetical protein
MNCDISRGRRPDLKEQELELMALISPRKQQPIHAVRRHRQQTLQVTGRHLLFRRVIAFRVLNLFQTDDTTSNIFLRALDQEKLSDYRILKSELSMIPLKMMKPFSEDFGQFETLGSGG